jgi:hypothetical protein
MPLTTVDQGLLSTNAQYTGFKNRLINGQMMIDQRNVGNTVTPSNETVTYITDRFAFIRSGATSPTLRQSTDAPVGFVNSLLFTNTSSGSTPTYAQVYQNIEGNNSEDFGWGTANASTVAVSFWVKSSLTGTFSVAIRNSASNRSYVSTYTISSANTWEYKTVTIPGDTSGTWLTDNGIGINLVFRIGGSGGTSTLNAWTATGDAFASGSVNVMGTANATWQITGVQLEKGSTATSFDYRPYTTELQLCQRYYEKSYPQNLVPGTSGYQYTEYTTCSYNNNTGYFEAMFKFQVMKRATPTIVTYDSAGLLGRGSYYVNGSLSNDKSITIGTGATDYKFYFYTDNSTSKGGAAFGWTASAEL